VYSKVKMDVVDSIRRQLNSSKVKDRKVHFTHLNECNAVLVDATCNVLNIVCTCNLANVFAGGPEAAGRAAGQSSVPAPARCKHSKAMAPRQAHM
jgi:hypothetical protein